MRAVFALLLLFAAPLHAECTGRNLIDALPAEQRAALVAAADAVPFARGNLWRATKDGATVTLVGTYHLDDPRHDETIAVLYDLLLVSSALLVEAGPAEEAALKAHVAQNPSALINTSGPTLPEALSQADWLRLSDALRARGIPPFIAAKMQPWYLSTMLSIPACQFGDLADLNGLDRRLIALAEDWGVPVTALEPFDTLFSIFDSFSPAEQRDLLIQSLDIAASEDALAVTLADAYFSGQSRLIWEFSKLQTQTLSQLSREDTEAEFAKVETVMITNRNRNWIAPIEAAAAAAEGPLIVAFGALHLSGDAGVLNLLAQGGWTVSPLK